MLDWLLLTKRPERITEVWPGGTYPNVWLGVSVETMEYLWRVDALVGAPADVPVRFVSYEPALGPITGVEWLRGIDWVIYGGESGQHFRKDDPQWARDVRDACFSLGIPFFYKQEAGRVQGMSPKLDGVEIRQLPKSVAVTARDTVLVLREEK